MAKEKERNIKVVTTGRPIMRFVTLFLKTENVHLTKDVGMIPYYLHRQYGYDCAIATYRNSDKYPYLDNEVSGLKLDFVNRSSLGIIIDGINYLRKNAKEIDILNIYHLNLSSYFYSIAFRLLNKKGIIYLKLDMNPIGLKNCLKKDLRGLVKRLTIRHCHIVSVETKEMHKKLTEYFGDKISLVTNGCFIDEKLEREPERFVSDKEKIILTVGNLGTWEKATDVLLEAFAKSSIFHDYTLRLIGPVAKGYESKIDAFFKQNENLKDRVIFTGAMSDKLMLLKEYERARFFALPSLTESFGIVLVEAGREGCHLITSDMVPAGADVSNNYNFGSLCEAGNADSLAEVFIKLCKKDNKELNNLGIREAQFVRETYNWKTIVSSLNEIIIQSVTSPFPNKE